MTSQRRSHCKRMQVVSFLTVNAIEAEIFQPPKSLFWPGNCHIQYLMNSHVSLLKDKIPAGRGCRNSSTVRGEKILYYSSNHLFYSPELKPLHRQKWVGFFFIPQSNFRFLQNHSKAIKILLLLMDLYSLLAVMSGFEIQGC